jgi:polysaccharide biosynthesis transport protein
LLDRRRRPLLITAGSIFLVSVLLCIFATRRYTASSVIELQKMSGSSASLDGLVGGDGDTAGDAMTLNVDLQTQSNILESDVLALRVIQELHLEQNEDFKSHFSPVGWVVGLFTPKGAGDPTHAPLPLSPHRRLHALLIFRKNLTVNVNAGTRLTEVTYTNPDPQVAADVVNRLIQELINYNYESRLAGGRQLSRGLEDQLSELRNHSEQLQSGVVDLKQRSGIFGIAGNSTDGPVNASSPVLENLDKSTAQLSQATMNRVLKQAVYDVVRSGDAEAISQLSGTQMGDNSQGANNSLELIQRLRQQESALQSQIEQESIKFGSSYPKLLQDRASLESVQRSLQDEIARIATRAKTDYEVAAKAEEGAKVAYETDRAAAEKLNSQGVKYSIASKEADQSQQLYQDLLKRLKEAGVADSLHAPSVAVVDAATPPPSPSKPNVIRTLVLGLLLGLFAGVVVAFVLDSLDTRVQGTEEIMAMNMPILGLVPQIQLDAAPPGGLLLDSHYSVFGEAVRGLRSTLVETGTGEHAQVLVVTSGNPREGKSALALNLAVSQAQFNKRVLLVEADLRRPVLRKILGLPGKDGLSDLLTDDRSRVTPHQVLAYMNLYCLPAGPLPPHPAELLGSERMHHLMREWRESYDFIVLDCPPVLPVTDTQYLESLADATFLVARAGATTKVALQRSYQLLSRHARDRDNPRIGVVLNFISLRSAAYYGYYGYSSDTQDEYENVESSE